MTWETRRTNRWSSMQFCRWVRMLKTCHLSVNQSAQECWFCPSLALFAAVDAYGVEEPVHVEEDPRHSDEVKWLLLLLTSTEHDKSFNSWISQRLVASFRHLPGLTQEDKTEERFLYSFTQFPGSLRCCSEHCLVYGFPGLLWSGQKSRFWDFTHASVQTPSSHLRCTATSVGTSAKEWTVQSRLCWSFVMNVSAPPLSQSSTRELRRRANQAFHILFIFIYLFGAHHHFRIFPNGSSKRARETLQTSRASVDTATTNNYLPEFVWITVATSQTKDVHEKLTFPNIRGQRRLGSIAVGKYLVFPFWICQTYCNWQKSNAIQFRRNCPCLNGIVWTNDATR